MRSPHQVQNYRLFLRMSEVFVGANKPFSIGSSSLVSILSQREWRMRLPGRPPPIWLAPTAARSDRNGVRVRCRIENYHERAFPSCGGDECLVQGRRKAMNLTRRNYGQCGPQCERELACSTLTGTTRRLGLIFGRGTAQR